MKSRTPRPGSRGLSTPVILSQTELTAGRTVSHGKAEVLSALLRLQARKRKLSPEELVALADQMVGTNDPEQADRLEKEILAGFYGD